MLIFSENNHDLIVAKALEKEGLGKKYDIQEKAFVVKNYLVYLVTSKKKFRLL